MGFDNTVTVVGNVTRDPELRFTQSGMAVANFGVAWNKRKQDGEDEGIGRAGAEGGVSGQWLMAALAMTAAIVLAGAAWFTASRRQA